MKKNIKSFSQRVEDEKVTTGSMEKIVDEYTTDKVQPIIKESEQQPSDQTNGSFSKEVQKAQLREEMQPLLEAEISKKYEDIYNVKLQEAVTEIREEMNSQLVKVIHESVTLSNDRLIECISLLCDKVEKLQESLNIDIPTPIVNVTAPNRTVIKKIHRDSKGHITHISEEIENPNDDDQS